MTITRRIDVFSSLHAGRSCLGVLCLAVLLAGCGKEENKPVVEKAAATIDGKAIGVDWVETELAGLGSMAHGEPQAMSDRVLQALINRQLLAKRALEGKLDQDPRVTRQLEMARIRILAEAQVKALTDSLATPDETAIKTYFETHPELFAKRRVYQLQELSIPTTPENVAGVSERVKAAKDINALAASLQKDGIPVRARRLSKPAEDLPADLLAKLTRLEIGKSLVMESGGGLSVVILAGAEDEPVAMEQAAPAIKRYLVNSGKQMRIEQEIEGLRKAAKIEYHAPYGPVKDAPNSPHR